MTKGYRYNLIQWKLFIFMKTGKKNYLHRKYKPVKKKRIFSKKRKMTWSKHVATHKCTSMCISVCGKHQHEYKCDKLNKK